VGAWVAGREFRGSQKGGAEIGVSYKGKGKRVVVLCDGHGLPLALEVGSAGEHELAQGLRVLDQVRVPRRRGRPRQRLHFLIADKGFSSAAFRTALHRRHIRSVIPNYRRGRPPKGDKPLKRRRKQPLRRANPLLLARRWPVERAFAWFDNPRRLIVCYERSSAHYRSFCILACILLSLTRLLK
jgi:transposase